jgi:hypothetical protein
MTRPKNKTTPPAPSAALVSRIDHLAALLRNLPASIPLDSPVSNYSFVLDPEKVEDRGLFGAFTDCMEICFKTFQAKDHVIHFMEIGKQLEGLTKLMKVEIKGMMEGDRKVFHEIWLERLIKAAVYVEELRVLTLMKYQQRQRWIAIAWMTLIFCSALSFWTQLDLHIVRDKLSIKQCQHNLVFRCELPVKESSICS